MVNNTFLTLVAEAILSRADGRIQAARVRLPVWEKVFIFFFEGFLDFSYYLFL